jgi:hypothetical protein
MVVAVYLYEFLVFKLYHGDVGRGKRVGAQDHYVVWVDVLRGSANGINER